MLTQLEREENLGRFSDPASRLLARILMGTGLRVGNGCKLPTPEPDAVRAARPPDAAR